LPLSENVKIVTGAGVPPIRLTGRYVQCHDALIARVAERLSAISMDEKEKNGKQEKGGTDEAGQKQDELLVKNAQVPTEDHTFESLDKARSESRTETNQLPPSLVKFLNSRYIRIAPGWLSIRKR
jgi:hypothetical protein